MRIVPFDIEADDFLESVTKVHCLSMQWGGEIKSTNNYQGIKNLLSMEEVVLVGHNAQCYDIPVLEKLLDTKTKCQVYDTLALSWYLYPNRSAHSLDSWGEELGYPKVKVDDEEWKDMSFGRAKERCERDVEIQTKLFDKIWNDLVIIYDGDEKIIHSLCRYLSFKMHTVSLQEKNPFTLDIEQTKKNLVYLEGIRDEKLNALKSVMPTVGVVSKVARPKNMYKKDGSLSSLGTKWRGLCEERNLNFETHTEPIEVIKDYTEPNPQSPQQVKDWLFSLGWKPQTFSDGVNGKVPQIYTQDKEICQSVLKLGDDVKYLDELGVLKHRIGLLKGFLRDARGKYINQSIAGFTSTLRLRHKFLVNQPKPSVPYGKLIREVLTCDEGFEICGSDLASLEDRTKIHYIYPLDPEYAKSMMEDGYDPHLTFAVYAKALTPEQAQAHKDGTENYKEIRHKYKQVNYMATYSVGAKKLADYLDIKVSEAKRMIDDYWGLNWAVKKFAESCETKQALGKTWIKNPLNNYWYELRNQKDAFSAVNQSTGSYIFDMWLKFIFEAMGDNKKITLQSHDEGGWILREGNRERFSKILKDAITRVNKTLKLNREMDIDIQWGNNYATVH